jgi:hypothetical protein
LINRSHTYPDLALSITAQEKRLFDGTRTTRIRTRDNPVALVPNSKIGRSLVVNYSYPDARYRVEVVLHVAYDTDLARLGRLGRPSPAA